MMKPITSCLSGVPLLLLACFLAIIAPASDLFSQGAKEALSVEVYTLDNGLTVYLNEDHSMPNIFGAVAVKAGSKRDPADATGIAHYFEHIMFKGTDQVGTLDYASEKVFLDSIAGLYDQLDAAREEQERLGIQAAVNRLSVEAARYAIPSELSRILAEMGGTNINAGTSFEDIVYYNSFPANQVEKWLKVYGHRFIHPVYRLFQSELETVYEEYNMYRDKRLTSVLDDFYHSLYPNHPYGVPRIGYPGDLKNPSLSKMDEYFRTYYVANNMGLFLTGNFSKEKVKPLINEYFGSWRSGEVPPMPSNYTISPFKGRTVVERRLTPVKAGIRAYRSVPVGDEDEPVLDVIGKILSNGGKTGLLDELESDHRLMMVYTQDLRFTDAGSEMIIFLPKVVGQSFKEADKLIAGKLEDLKAGRFDDKLLEGVKNQLIVNYERIFEDQNSRGNMMIRSFVTQRSWNDVLDYPARIRSVRKQDVIRVANRYYGPDYLVYYSRTGFPKKSEQLKPPFAPIPSINTDKKSLFAMAVDSMPVLEITPDYLVFGPPGTDSADVIITDLDPLSHLYYVKNPINDLFQLTLRFGIGTNEMPQLEQVAEYMNLVGTGEMTFKEFSRAIQELGGSYGFMSGKDYFGVSLSGPEMNLESILELAARLLYSPRPDQERISNLAESSEARTKVISEDPEILGQALYLYAAYGNKSPFLNRLSTQEIKSLTTDSLHAWLKKATRVEADIHYSGSTGLAELGQILKDRLGLDSISIQSNEPVRNPLINYSGPVVFFLDDSKSIQSKNFLFLAGGTEKKDERPYQAAYYVYLSGGMQSVIYQEIREFRSLAYATGAFYQGTLNDKDTLCLSTFVGTQADKSREAIDVMYNIITTPPEKSDRMEMVRKSLIQSVNSDKPGFRYISLTVAALRKNGYTTDPTRQFVEVYKGMTFDDITRFYNRQFLGKPVVITIIGDKGKMGTDWLHNYGKVTEVQKEELYR